MKMKWCIVLCLFIALPAMAQRPNDEVVTDEDTQIQFFGAASPGEGDWTNIVPDSIVYSIEPLSLVHRTKVKLGIQTWEFALQKGVLYGMPGYEKVVVTFPVDSIPDGFRVMKFRSRVRGYDGVDMLISDWGEPNMVKIIGKPGKAFLVE